MFLVLLVTWAASFIICYLIWTTILKYNPPIPFFGLLYFFLNRILSQISFPFLLPSSVTNEIELKEKLKYFTIFELCLIITFFNMSFLTTIFMKLENTNAQCIMALLIPAAKGFNKLICSKVLHKVAGTEDKRANALLTIKMNCTYGLYVAICLVGARSTTVFCLVVSEFLIQSHMTYQIVKLHKITSFPGDAKLQKNKKKAITNLILAELGEGLVPLSYALSFSMAYYGPNAELIGNIKNGYWQFKAVDDESWTFLIMLGLFTTDLVCLVVNAIIIWNSSNVNILREFCFTLKKNWYIMALVIANDNYFRFLLNDVNLALDLTGEFSWITNYTNFNATYNSSIKCC